MLKENKNEIMEHWTNCIISYCREDDLACHMANMKLVGGAWDKEGKEVHIFTLRKGEK